MMNSTERIISFHRRQTIHLFHFGSSCHIQNMIFIIKCQLNFIEKDFFYLIFCLYLPNVRLFTLQEPIRFGAARTSSSGGAKKGHNTKSWKCTFLRLSQRAFALDTKGTFTIFVPTSRVTVREKKNRHFVYKSRKLREKTEKMHWSGRSSRHSRTESSSSSVAKKMTRNSNFGVFNENKGRCTITLLYTSLFLTF